MRKIFYVMGNLLGILGTVILSGCIVVWLIGLEALSNFYAGNKPLVIAAGAGFGLLVLGITFSTIAGGKQLVATSEMPAGSATVTEGSIPCGKCEAANDRQAKFCDQCGANMVAG